MDATTIIAAYRQAIAPPSIDDMIVCDELNRRFIAACRKAGLKKASESDLNWRLINARKKGLVGNNDFKDGNRCRHTQLPACKIAAETMIERHNLSLDRIMCDPKLRAEFDEIARQRAPTEDLYLLRKGALYLRKQGKLKGVRSAAVVGS